MNDAELQMERIKTLLYQEQQESARLRIELEKEKNRNELLQTELMRYHRFKAMLRQMVEK